MNLQNINNRVCCTHHKHTSHQNYSLSIACTYTSYSQLSVCAIFLDYQKAFDNVPHAPLMRKLHNIGLYNNLLVWLFDYLTLSKQQVAIEGATSSQATIAS